jgi:hypothetical protein
MCAIYRARENDAADRVLVAMIAEVLLVCATALAFFVQFNLPISVATGCALAVLFIGSIFCWKSALAATAILAISLLSVQIMLILRFPILLLPFALVDIVLVMVVAGGYQAGEQTRAA